MEWVLAETCPSEAIKKLRERELSWCSTDIPAGDTLGRNDILETEAKTNQK
jgi:hypothetical protein